MQTGRARSHHFIAPVWLGVLALSLLVALACVVPASALAVGSISGRVTSDGTTGIEGISVNALRWVWDAGMSEWAWSFEAGTFTDAAGDYLLSDLPAGDYLVMVVDDLGIYAPEFWQDSPDIATATTIPVADGAAVTGIDPVLGSSGHITGMVTNLLGSPLPDITITAYEYDAISESWYWAAETTTAPDGTYDLDGLSGTYNIEFRDAIGGVYLTEYYDDVTDIEFALDVAVAGGSTVPGIDAQLAAGGSIAGTVRSDSGVGLFGIDVDLYFDDPVSGWVLRGTGSTAAGGAYSFTGLPPGDYRIGYTDGTMYRSEFYDDRADFASADTVAVASGADLAGVDATLTAVGSVRGTVYGADGTTPLPGMLATAWWFGDIGFGPQWVQEASVLTGVDGTYAIGDLEPRTYKVQFSDPGAGYLTEYYDDAESLAAGSWVTVLGGTATLGIDAVMEQAGSIAGIVTGSGGGTLGSVEVSVLRWSGAAWVLWDTALTAADGTYQTAALPPDDYLVGFVDMSGQHFPEFFDDATTIAGATPVTVSSGAISGATDAVLTEGGHISGSVTDALLAPLAGVTVRVWYDDPGTGWGVVAETTTTALGTYSIDGLSAATYAVQFVDGSGLYAAEYYSDVRDIAMADPVAVTLGATTAGVDALLEERGDIEVTVTNALAAPRAGITVELYFDDPVLGWTAVATATTDASGLAAFAGRIPGDYRVRCSDPAAVLPAVWYDGVKDVADAATVVLAAGDTLALTQPMFVDTGAPITTSGIDPAWQQGPVSVTLDATDVGAAGIAHTYVGLDETPTATPAYLYAGTFSVSGEGTTSVRYFSVDRYGNAEPVKADLVRIDDTAPLAGTNIDGNWHADVVWVTIAGSDALSGVSNIWYTAGGGPVTPYTGAFPVTAVGPTVVNYLVEDGAGNGTVGSGTVYVDPLDPTTTSDINETWRTTPATVTLSAEDTGGSGLWNTFYTLNGSDPVTYTAPFQVSGEGTTTVMYWSVDGVGNADIPSSKNVRIDTTPPTTGSDVHATYIGSATVNFFPSDAGSGVATTWYNLDGTGWTTGSSASTTAVGPHTVEWYSVDQLGNTEAPNSAAFLLSTIPDNDGPVTTITAPAGWTSDPAMVSIVASDGALGTGVKSVYYTVDGGAQQTYAGPFAISGSGSHTVVAWAVDWADNVGATDSASVQVDGTDPTVSANIDTAWHAGSFTVTLGAGDAHSGVAAVSYTLDGGPTQTYSGPFSVNANGATTVEYWAVDNVGNASAHATGDVLVDSLAPITGDNISSAWRTTPLTVTLTPGDSGQSGVAATYYRLNGGPQLTYTVPFSVSDEGTTAVTFWSVDAVGNVETATTKNVRIDTTPPSTIDDAQAEYWGSATVNLAPSDSGSGVGLTFYSLDGAAATAGTSVTTALLGGHTLQYRSVDAVGNSETTHTVNFTLYPPDLSGPVTAITASSAWSASPVPVSVAATDGVGGSGVDTVYYRVDGGAPQVYAGAFSFATNGVHTLEAWATDRAGNTGASDSVTVRYDSAPPVTTSNIDPAWRTTPFDVELTATDAGSGVASTMQYLNGVWSSYAGTFTVSAEGVNQVGWASVDNVGNTETTRSATVNIDVTPPTVTCDTPDGTYVEPLVVTISGTDALSGVAGLDISRDGTTVAGTGAVRTVTMSTPGTYTVTFAGTDVAGNSSAVETRTYEVVPPVFTPVDVEGTDRYSTAVETSKLAFPDGARSVVIASGANWPDALGGGALAGTLKGPVLLVKPNAVPDVVAEEVARLGVRDVIVVGGPAAIGEGVLAALDSVPGVRGVERIGGVDRYDTARLIAERVKLERDELDTYDGVVFIATGENYPDALAASPLAAHNSWPILLTRYGALPVATREALVSLGAGEALILGGEAVISAEVETKINEVVTHTKAQRLAGVNRFETAVEVAVFGVRPSGLQWNGVALATGRAFPDALAGGAAQGFRRAPILLTEPDSLPAATADCLADHRGEIIDLWFLGGDAAISADVRDSVTQLMQ